MTAPRGTALRLLAMVFLFIAFMLGLVVYGGVSNASGRFSPDPLDYLPIIGSVSGPLLIASMVAWAGGITVDAVMYGKERVDDNDLAEPDAY